MALLMFQGFEDTIYEQGWSGHNQGLGGTGRISGKAATLNGAYDNWDYHAYSPVAGIYDATRTYYFGTAVKFSNTGVNVYLGFTSTIANNAPSGFSIHLNRSSGTLATVTPCLNGVDQGSPANYDDTSMQWNYIEGSYDAATGDYAIKVNGSVVLTGSVTPTAFTNFQISGYAGYVGIASVDDVYLLDSTGDAPHNTFLGNAHIISMIPTGTGDSSELVNSAGNSTSNYSYVGHTTSQSAQYVEADSAGLSDLYTIGGGTGPVPENVTVYATQIVAYCAQTEAGEAVGLAAQYSDGTNILTDPEFAMTASYAARAGQIRTTAPDGGAWTPDKVNGVQIGLVTS